jgi:hypothetical protein
MPTESKNTSRRMVLGTFGTAAFAARGYFSRS